VFRIVQEALVNVAKHARATRVSVALQLTQDAVSLDVRDDGIGFDTAAPRKAGSLGLAGLRERAHLAMGTVDIESRPGEGTRVKAVIPVREGQP
jgi:signal transduction histidine kinase